MVKGVSLDCVSIKYPSLIYSFFLFFFFSFQELEILEPGAKVLKLVGPVMMSIELNEALQNVTKRLEFIEAEVKKVDSGIEAKQKEQNDLGDEIAKLQQQMQADAVSAAKQVAGLA